MGTGPGAGMHDARDERAEAAEQARISRVVHRETMRVIVVVTVSVALLGGVLWNYGDPAGPADVGTVDVDLEWRVDGRIDTTIRTDLRGRSERRELAHALVPAAYPAGARVDVTVPRSPRDPIRATSRGAIADTSAPLHLELQRLVDSAAGAGVRIATLHIQHPFVARDLTADPAPDGSGTTWVSWDDVGSDEVPELTIALQPDGALWAVALAGLVVLGFATLVAALVVPRRARAGGIVGPPLRRRFNLLLTLCGVGIVAAVVVTSRSDHLLVAYDIDTALRPVLVVVPFLPFALAGAGLALTANAFTIREREAARGGGASAS